MKSSVLIIECRDKVEDPGSEGRFIMHMLNLMGIKNDYQPAPSKARFIELLTSALAQTDVIHIATHGRWKTTKKGKPEFIAFWTPDDQEVTMKEIEAADIDLSGKTVISTACFSGQKKPREAFKKATRCKHYIAPIKGPNFYNASFMCHIFYHKHFILKRSVRKAYSEYRTKYKNPHKFCFL